MLHIGTVGIETSVLVLNCLSPESSVWTVSMCRTYIVSVALLARLFRYNRTLRNVRKLYLNPRFALSGSIENHSNTFLYTIRVVLYYVCSTRRKRYSYLVYASTARTAECIGSPDPTIPAVHPARSPHCSCWECSSCEL